MVGERVWGYNNRKNRYQKEIQAMLINNPQICVLIFGSPPWVYSLAP
jgi:hypothetical protein